MYKPNFSINSSILNNVAQIEVARATIDNAPIIPSWERKFQQDALVRQVHHSTAIEENGLNYTEVKKVLGGEEVRTVRRRDIKEIINYRKAVEFIDVHEEELSAGFIIDLNEIVLDGIIEKNKIGRLRDQDVVIMNSRDNDVILEPPKSDEIQILIDELIEWFNSDKETHPVIKSGILQYEITAIHPFIEGNGRTARLLSTWSLYTTGYKINNFFSLEEYYDVDSTAYYQALSTADESGEHTEWLDYYTKGLALEFSRIKDKVQRLSRDVVLKNKLGKQIAISERQIKIINFIQENGFLQNTDFNLIFPKISDDTVLRELKDLIDKKLLKKMGRTRGAKYILNN